MYYLWFPVPQMAIRSIEDVGLPCTAKNYKRHFGSNLSSLDCCVKENCHLYGWGYFHSWLRPRCRCWIEIEKMYSDSNSETVVSWKVANKHAVLSFSNALTGNNSFWSSIGFQNLFSRLKRFRRVLRATLYWVHINTRDEREKAYGWGTSQDCSYFLSFPTFNLLMLARQEIVRKSRYYQIGSLTLMNSRSSLDALEGFPVFFHLEPGCGIIPKNLERLKLWKFSEVRNYDSESG